MDGYTVRDFLRKDKVVGLNLLLVTGEETRVNEIENKKLNGNVLYVESPKDEIINLDHVVSIKPIYEIDYDAVTRVF